MKLPDYLIESTLKDLMPNEQVYTAPWAMYADTEGNLWLNGNYSFEYEPFGTVQMGVKRIDGGYEVDLSICKDQRYSPTGTAYYGDFIPLEVVELL